MNLDLMTEKDRTVVRLALTGSLTVTDRAALDACLDRYARLFPWLGLWENNTVALYAPWLADIWGSPYLRGALSGLGLVNIYISFLEILRLIRGQFES